MGSVVVKAHTRAGKSVKAHTRGGVGVMKDGTRYSIRSPLNISARSMLGEMGEYGGIPSIKAGRKILKDASAWKKRNGEMEGTDSGRYMASMDGERDGFLGYKKGKSAEYYKNNNFQGKGEKIRAKFKKHSS